MKETKSYSLCSYVKTALKDADFMFGKTLCYEVLFSVLTQHDFKLSPLKST